MPKRKTLPKVIKGTGNNELKALVQKARPLQSLAETELTLPEFKILDVYLGRIDSHNHEERTVILEKGELEKTLGVTEIKKDDLEQRLRHLFQVVKVRDDTKKKGFKLINLFEEADAEQDDDGIWTIQLTCTTSAREYIFNIDNIGYLRYRLKNVIDLTSRYSYVLFLYLVDNRFRKSWSIDLAELKILLSCNAERYNQFKFFNSEILKKCHKEITEKTDICFSYQTKKRGRCVSEIEFTVLTDDDEISDIIQPADELPGQMSFDGVEEDHWLEVYGSEQLANLAEVCRYEFGKSDMELVSRILTRVNIPKDPTTDSLEWGRVFYLQEKYTALCSEDAKKERKGERIKDRFAYFKAMLERDTFQPAAF